MLRGSPHEDKRGGGGVHHLHYPACELPVGIWLATIWKKGLDGLLV